MPNFTIKQGYRGEFGKGTAAREAEESGKNKKAHLVTPCELRQGRIDETCFPYK